ncbi:MAG: ABC transporter permease [Thermoplasmata archaeon]|nr:ABC transporter permease [Thermoplasmata archaeon]
MKLWIFVVRRLLLVIPVVIGVMTITFILLWALPPQQEFVVINGSPRGGLTMPCADNASQTCNIPAYQKFLDQYRANPPYQWAKYVYNSLTLNLGNTDKNSQASISYGLAGQSIAVTTVLSWYLPYTLELAAFSLLIILLVSIPLGNLSAVNRNRPVDQAARIVSFSGIAIPGFLLATLLLYGVVDASGGLTKVCNGNSFAYLNWVGSWPDPHCFAGGALPSWIGPNQQTYPTGFPTVDALYNGSFYFAAESVKRMVLPALIIAYGSIGVLLRFVRSSMLEVMNQDFIRTARAKGVSERVVIARHAGRNSLTVTITILGLTFAGFIGGFAVIETVFQLHGIGLLLTRSIIQPFDYGLIFGTTLVFTYIVVAANLIVDVLYSFLDPRVRLG